jgi:hypothetical protein
VEGRGARGDGAQLTACLPYERLAPVALNWLSSMAPARACSGCAQRFQEPGWVSRPALVLLAAHGGTEGG